MRRIQSLEHYLLALDDDSFFAVIRNYLGPVQTPYHKHDLVTRLIEFLGKPQTFRRIESLLGDRERRALAAIALLNGPTIEQLCRFLGESRGAVTTVVLNLRDRLLVIEDAERLAINPVLEKELVVDAAHPQRIIRGETIAVSDSDDEPPWWGLAVAAALYAFLRDNPDIHTRNGALRKKVRSEIEARFGGLFIGDVGEQRFEEALASLENLELVTRQDGSVTVHPRNWEALAELPEAWSAALLWSATVTGSLNAAFRLARSLLEIGRNLPGDQAFVTAEMTRLLFLAVGDDSLAVDHEMVTRLIAVGVFVAADSDDTLVRVNRHLSDIERDLAEARVVVLGNMEVVVPPNARFETAIAVARIAQLQRYDRAARYLLTRETITSSIRDGVAAPIEVLETVVRAEVPQNVRFLLKRWSSRSRALRLIDGAVLIAEPEEAEVLTDFADFAELVQERPAPGVFVIARRSVSRAREVIDRLGLRDVLSVEMGEIDRKPVPDYEVQHARATQPALRAGPDVVSILKAEVPVTREVADPRADLHQALDERDISEDDRRELAHRIDRGLILFADQLRGEVRSSYATEARGLDYLGKIRIIEQAISSGDMLEIVMRDTSNPHRLLVRPREVSRTGEDLMLRAVQEPEATAVKIRIRRISLIRRLSGTLIRR